MIPRPVFFALVLLCLNSLSTAAPGPTPESVGLSSSRLARIGPWVERLQAEQKIAGAVTLVARRGQLVHLEAHGLADLETRRPMRTDDIFALASMTKPITAVAVLMLLEEQKLLLTDPLEKFLPAFARRQVAVPRADTPIGYELVPAARSITILDLLTHRAGFPGLPQDDGPVGKLWSQAIKSLPADYTLQDYVERLATLPLHSQPGTQWRYGDATLVLGRVIEIASGQSLDRFMAERIFAPLGMSDTSFTLPPEKRGRLASLYQRTAGQPLTKLPSRNPAPRMFNAGGGLFSTAPDYLRFCQMLLNGGELAGHRLLSRKAVELMATAQVEQIPLSFLAGQGYGLQVAVLQPTGASGLLGSPGTYGWSGAHNTYFRIDPKEQLIFAIFQQQAPGNDQESTYGFQNLVLSSLDPLN
ncbi:MAG: serine hydrolase domain-containing protein [Opitutaceae bacterium]